MDDMDLPMPDVEVGSLSPDELKDRIDAGEDVTLLDTRTKSEYDECKLDGETYGSMALLR